MPPLERVREGSQNWVNVGCGGFLISRLVAKNAKQSASESESVLEEGKKNLYDSIDIIPEKKESFKAKGKLPFLEKHLRTNTSGCGREKSTPHRDFQLNLNFRIRGISTFSILIVLSPRATIYRFRTSCCVDFTHKLTHTHTHMPTKPAANRLPSSCLIQAPKWNRPCRKKNCFLWLLKASLLAAELKTPPSYVARWMSARMM
jgi:hypothetical protein